MPTDPNLIDDVQTTTALQSPLPRLNNAAWDQQGMRSQGTWAEGPYSQMPASMRLRRTTYPSMGDMQTPNVQARTNFLRSVAANNAAANAAHENLVNQTTAFNQWYGTLPPDQKAAFTPTDTSATLVGHSDRVPNTLQMGDNTEGLTRQAAWEHFQKTGGQPALTIATPAGPTTTGVPLAPRTATSGGPVAKPLYGTPPAATQPAVTGTTPRVVITRDAYGNIIRQTETSGGPQPKPPVAADPQKGELIASQIKHTDLENERLAHPPEPQMTPAEKATADYRAKKDEADRQKDEADRKEKADAEGYKKETDIYNSYKEIALADQRTYQAEAQAYAAMPKGNPPVKPPPVMTRDQWKKKQGVKPNTPEDLDPRGFGGPPGNATSAIPPASPDQREKPIPQAQPSPSPGKPVTGEGRLGTPDVHPMQPQADGTFIHAQTGEVYEKVEGGYQKVKQPKRTTTPTQDELNQVLPLQFPTQA